MKIKKDRRNNGIFFHKCPELNGITKARSEALKDITDYLHLNEKGTINYVAIESTVLKYCHYRIEVLTINTNLL